MCAGAVGTQAPILAHDLRSISLASHAAKNFCSTVFGLCPLQNTIPYDVQFDHHAHDNETRGVVGTEMVGGQTGGGRGKGKEWRSRGRTPFQVVHLSDVHVDRSYAVSWACSRISGARSEGC